MTPLALCICDFRYERELTSLGESNIVVRGMILTAVTWLFTLTKTLPHIAEIASFGGYVAAR